MSSFSPPHLSPWNRPRCNKWHLPMAEGGTDVEQAARLQMIITFMDGCVDHALVYRLHAFCAVDLRRFGATYSEQLHRQSSSCCPPRLQQRHSGHHPHRLISLCPNGCLGTPLDKILSRVAVLEGEGIMYPTLSNYMRRFIFWSGHKTRSKVLYKR
ncbi:hypothetical protein BJV74DRAFT_99333 [Russula compacta]|nr:hypothetical protein BJV74DRAFT_99333 [Russula compacta]